MKASEIKKWPVNLSASEWPNGALEQMDANLFVDCVFPLRKSSGIPMTPSSLLGAHVRSDGNSQHSTQGGTRLSTATDIQVSSISRMVSVMNYAEQLPSIGGIGIYFDTNKPLIHIDSRKGRLVWIARKNEKGEREYIYRENDSIKFYKTLAEEIKKAGL